MPGFPTPISGSPPGRQNTPRPDAKFNSYCYPPSSSHSSAATRSSRGDHRTLILDATPLELIDATDFDRLRRVIDTARLMGVETIIVGLKPGVAAGLVESDANVEGLITTLNMEKALQLAKRAERRI